MNILIIGAGMAGLVAANILRRHNVTIWEKSVDLPHNHTAVLRFRTQAVSNATGIPFTHEVVRKGLWKNGSVVNEVTLWDSNRYSMMVTGGHLYNRSILNLKEQERWCAPPDFIQQMAKNLSVEFDMQFTNPAESKNGIWGAIISTIPMPFMMDMFGWKDKPEFYWLPVWTIKGVMQSPRSMICQTLYQTNPNSWYRATIHGQEVTLEFMFDPTYALNSSVTPPKVWADHAVTCFGLGSPFCSFGWKVLPQLNKIPIGKIQPIDERVRKRFMLWLTEKHNIYSLGRFATWRNILLDDIVDDVKRIESMMEGQSTYDLR